MLIVENKQFTLREKQMTEITQSFEVVCVLLIEAKLIYNSLFQSMVTAFSLGN